MAGTRLCGAPKPSLPTTSRPTLTPQARRTFQESFDSFEKTVQRYSRTDDREFSNTTLRDVRDAAKEVERQLAARQCMRNMKRLEPFLNGLEAYSKVIEVLCNGTPFLSWIWAPIKLMMQLATDYISAFEKLLAAYSQIAAMLPRFDRLGAALQDKPDFQQALAVVYSDILTFHEHAYKLFKRNGWMCFFKSSWGQFGSRFNCILESLEKHATLIDQEANAYLISETMQWRREALQAVAKTERDRSTAQLTAALAWLGLETVPHCGQAYQDNLLHRLINDCCDGTTDWILKHQRMRQWLQHGRGGPILWLKGKPGSGKSTLCAKILQFLRAPRQSTVLFCFYSYIVSSTYPDPVVFILATLVSQVLRQRSDLATYVYEEFVAESRPLSIRSLQELLSNLLPQLVMPRILIDGIDECIRYDIHGKPCDLTPVKDVLVSILQLENPMQACAPTKILIVSRDILELVGKLSKRPTVALDQESDALTADITRYATKCLETIRDRFSNLVGVENVLNDVKRNVVLKSQGMFLWVRLVLAQLEFDAYNLDDLENAVANMPHSLHDFYSRIVHRIMLYPTQSRERTINILKWMMCSRRPLRVTELQDAIVFASGAVSLSERSKLPPNIVDLCKPLIQTDDNGQISFVHFTVQEYLTKSNFISLRDAESCTTITCLNYLTFSLNLSDSSIPVTQKAVDVGRCLYSLQPYIHEHWFDHLLAFAAQVSHSTDRQLEAFLASFFYIYSHQYTRYLDPTDDLQVDVLAAQTLEPRLQYLERYEHHYKFLCAYVAYRHAKQMHFENPADYREPLDPTPLSVVQSEYATQIDYLLLAVNVPGLTQEQLNTFKTSNSSYAFVCRFPGCTGMLAGFPTDDLRTQHEMTHKPALFCTHSGCTYKLPFASQQSLRRHIRTFHDSVPRSAPKSIRRRRVTHSMDRDDHARTPNAPRGLDVYSQTQNIVAGSLNSLRSATASRPDRRELDRQGSYTLIQSIEDGVEPAPLNGGPESIQSVQPGFNSNRQNYITQPPRHVPWNGQAPSRSSMVPRSGHVVFDPAGEHFNYSDYLDDEGLWVGQFTDPSSLIPSVPTKHEFPAEDREQPFGTAPKAPRLKNSILATQTQRNSQAKSVSPSFSPISTRPERPFALDNLPLPLTFGPVSPPSPQPQAAQGTGSLSSLQNATGSRPNPNTKYIDEDVDFFDANILSSYEHFPRTNGQVKEYPLNKYPFDTWVQPFANTANGTRTQSMTVETSQTTKDEEVRKAIRPLSNFLTEQFGSASGKYKAAEKSLMVNQSITNSQPTYIEDTVLAPSPSTVGALGREASPLVEYRGTGIQNVDKRRKLNRAAVKAVIEAGGDIDSSRRLEREGVLVMEDQRGDITPSASTKSTSAIGDLGSPPRGDPGLPPSHGDHDFDGMDNYHLLDWDDLMLWGDLDDPQVFGYSAAMEPPSRSTMLKLPELPQIPGRIQHNPLDTQKRSRSVELPPISTSAPRGDLFLRSSGGSVFS